MAADGPDYQGRSSQLRESGLIVFLTLEAPARLGSPQEPSSREVKALVDTGAHYSMVRRDIADELGLVEVDRIQLVTFAGLETCPAYHVKVSVGVGANRRVWSDQVMIVAGEFKESGTEFLLGRDVLQHCSLEIEGPIGRFTLNFHDGPVVE